ncbi:MAG: recombinase family protein [Erysipelotrichaceae bacterium]|nr:recombinase family protein [Erysipelotrichaceae bacterium]
MSTWGYIIVSSKDQNEDIQIIEIESLVTTKDHLIIEKISGKDFNRPKYQSMKNLMNDNDTLVIKSLDRLGRNYEAIKEEWQDFKKRNIHVRVLDMPLLNTENKDDLTANLINDVVLELLSYVAESERKNAKQRQKEGIKAAKDKGVKFGRPSVELPDNWDSVIKDWKAGKITAKQAMDLTGMKRTSFYKLIKK